MGKSIFEQMGGTYTLGEDGMYYPDLKLPTDEEPRYGKYGRIRKTFLQKHRYGLYLEFLLNSQLESDLSRGDYTKRQDKISDREIFSIMSSDELVSKVKELNREIAADKSLGKGFCIGHSYFCGKDVCTDEWLHSIVDYDILPMLSEYWFDDTSKLRRWENILQGMFQ